MSAPQLLSRLRLLRLGLMAVMAGAEAGLMSKLLAGHPSRLQLLVTTWQPRVAPTRGMLRVMRCWSSLAAMQVIDEATVVVQRGAVVMMLKRVAAMAMTLKLWPRALHVMMQP